MAPPKYVHPVLGKDSFSCPHCGALAHQTWYRLFAWAFEGKNRPFAVLNEENIEAKTKDIAEKEVRKILKAYYTKRLAKEAFFDAVSEKCYTDQQLDNCFVSRCYSCSRLSIWLKDSVIAPESQHFVESNEDLSDDIKRDFNEAAKILESSPRGAAALLRLCVQKLCKELGEDAKNLDDAIAGLVAKGLPSQVQESLDLVRVIGNEAVHPGVMDLRDDQATALTLFDAINLIADSLISRPKRINEMYAKLPANKIAAIQARDGNSKP